MKSLGDKGQEILFALPPRVIGVGQFNLRNAPVYEFEFDRAYLSELWKSRDVNCNVPDLIHSRNILISWKRHGFRDKEFSIAFIFHFQPGESLFEFFTTHPEAKTKQRGQSRFVQPAALPKTSGVRAEEKAQTHRRKRFES